MLSSRASRSSCSRRTYCGSSWPPKLRATIASSSSAATAACASRRRRARAGGERRRRRRPGRRRRPMGAGAPLRPLGASPLIKIYAKLFLRDFCLFYIQILQFYVTPPPQLSANCNIYMMSNASSPRELRYEICMVIKQSECNQICYIETFVPFVSPNYKMRVMQFFMSHTDEGFVWNKLSVCNQIFTPIEHWHEHFLTNFFLTCG
jgi:hypothetical protein